ncbi:hypothetical protein [Microcoleus sp. F4-D5]|uniref:hypothetical protein n=1 Tax=Microcoleus sp. F4-D5 TaxID=2818760 RepID=UPI002FD1CAF3
MNRDLTDLCNEFNGWMLREEARRKIFPTFSLSPTPHSPSHLLRHSPRAIGLSLGGRSS